MAERIATRGSVTRVRRLGLILATVVVAGAGCTPMDNALVAIFGRSMRDQPSIASYEAPRYPPAGAVPFASGNFPAGPYEVGLGQAEGTAMPAPVTAATLSQVVMDNPVEADEASLARGKVVFERGCAPCHGMNGGGGGTVAVVQPIFDRSLLTPAVVAYTDAYIYSMIRIGRGLMPPYGHQISHYDRWHVVNYLRQLQGQ